MNWKQFFKPLFKPKTVFWILCISLAVVGLMTWLEYRFK